MKSKSLAELIRQESGNLCIKPWLQCYFIATLSTAPTISPMLAGFWMNRTASFRSASSSISLSTQKDPGRRLDLQDLLKVV